MNPATKSAPNSPCKIIPLFSDGPTPSLKKRDHSALTENSFFGSHLSVETISPNPSIDCSSYILPSLSPDDCSDLQEEHSAEPIKNPQDIIRIAEYFLSNKKYRDLMLFTIGIYTGLRYSDLSQLRFSTILDETNHLRDEWSILEKKTRNTKGRSQKRIDINSFASRSDESILQVIRDSLEENAKYTHQRACNRHIGVNDAIKWSIQLYLKNTPPHNRDEFLFKNESRNTQGANKPMSRYGMQSMLTNVIQNKLGIQIRTGTHILRKTFGYQFMMQHQQNPRALQTLQQMFGHSSESVTLRYIGLTAEELHQNYMNLDLYGQWMERLEKDGGEG